MSETAKAAQGDAPVAGILCLVVGVFIFMLQDVVIRQLSSDFSAYQIVFVRGIVGIVVLSVILYADGEEGLIYTDRPILLIVRGFLGLMSYSLYYLALSSLPLATTVTLFYASPLFVTALSVVFLGERVDIKRWLGVLVGFGGVVVVTNPGAGLVEPAALLAIASAVTYSLMVLLTRKLSKNASGATMSFYSMLTFIVASGLFGVGAGDGYLDVYENDSLQFLLRAWGWMPMREFLLMAFTGLTAGIGFYLLSQAYRLGEASAVAPFEYSSLPWAILWGYVFWNEIPSANTLVGVVLIVGAGLYILHREAQDGRKLNFGRPIRPKI
ncbi:DMT family transporter [Coralliovum pocilloporae]|uniref:DMT family transporter n=1 Tax=Coralliovum pocilloporae TaxID=3066369 RepID=UPI003307513E